MSLKTIIRYGWWWGRASSFYFERNEQNEMCLTVRLVSELVANSLYPHKKCCLWDAATG